MLHRLLKDQAFLLLLEIVVFVCQEVQIVELSVIILLFSKAHQRKLFRNILLMDKLKEMIAIKRLLLWLQKAQTPVLHHLARVQDVLGQVLMPKRLRITIEGEAEPLVIQL